MLKISNLVKEYNDFSLNCSMEIQPGCITGFIGRNGAGKSTTFKAVLGLIHMDGGSVEILGKDAASLTAQDRQKLGIVLSDSGFSTAFTLKDVFHILKNMYREFDSDWFLAQCRHYKLPENKKIKDFSTGMRAKLKLLVALCHNASLLILDEPTVGLDVMVRDEVLDMFERTDKKYMIKYKKESYGYRCLTDQRQFYLENYPDIVVEKGNIDDLIVMMIGGTKL